VTSVVVRNNACDPRSAFKLVISSEGEDRERAIAELSRYKLLIRVHLSGQCVNPILWRTQLWPLCSSTKLIEHVRSQETGPGYRGGYRHVETLRCPYDRYGGRPDQPVCSGLARERGSLSTDFVGLHGPPKRDQLP
jgi:hypothetical protein